MKILSILISIILITSCKEDSDNIKDNNNDLNPIFKNSRYYFPNDSNTYYFKNDDGNLFRVNAFDKKNYINFLNNVPSIEFYNTSDLQDSCFYLTFGIYFGIYQDQHTMVWKEKGDSAEISFYYYDDLKSKQTISLLDQNNIINFYEHDTPTDDYPHILFEPGRGIVEVSFVITGGIFYRTETDESK